MKALGTLLGIALLGLSAFALPGHASAFALPATYVADTPQQQICAGVGLTTSDGSCGDQGAQVSTVLKNVINVLSLLVGIITVIMIIISGFRYVTSGGDSGKVASAKNTLIYALIGLVVVALSQGIVLFVLNKVPH